MSFGAAIVVTYFWLLHKLLCIYSMCGVCVSHVVVLLVLVPGTNGDSDGCTTQPVQVCIVVLIEGTRLIYKQNSTNIVASVAQWTDLTQKNYQELNSVTHQQQFTERISCPL